MSLKDLYMETMELADARQLDGFLDRFTPDCAWKVPGAELHGREELAGWLAPFWAGFSTFRHEIHALAEDGDTVVGEGTWIGVHDGPLPTPSGDLPPSGREVRFDFAMIARGDVAVGKASSVHIYYDQLDFLGQLGALAQPESVSG
jgi:hypothetical protein